MRAGWVRLVWIGLMALAAAGAGAQPSAISYQGSLRDGGTPAEGAYDLRFGLYAAASGGTALAEVERLGVAVSGGVFSVELDFGAQAFVDGGERWVEVAARPAGGEGAFVTLSPRSRLTATPYAVRAAVAGEAAWAADGPFAPADETPRSTSGLVGGAAVTALASVNGGAWSPVGVAYPVTMERQVAFGGGGIPVAGQMMGARLTVFRGWSGGAWGDAFEAGQSSFAVTLEVEARNGASAAYQFSNARPVGYRIEVGSDGGPVEVMELFVPAASVQRARSGDAPADAEAPRKGGASLGPSGAPGLLVFRWDGAAPMYSSAGTPPREWRPIDPVSGMQTGAMMFERVGILSNVLSDGVLWESFRVGHTRPLDLRVLPSGPTVWSAGAPAMVVRWELHLADDGLPFERYEAVYRGNGGSR